MAAVISIKGIDEAISNLNYRNPQALKSRLVHVILGFYKDKSPVESLRCIDAEEIVRPIWDTGDDPGIIKAKRKNLSSTKSSVNADLRRLFKEGKNPEGVIIGRDNVFVMSDEAKDEILSTFSAGAAEGEADSMRQIAESLSVIKEVLSKRESLPDAKTPDGVATLEDLRNTIQRLTEKIGIGGQERGLPEVTEAKEAPEEIIEDNRETPDAADVVKEILTEEEELDELEDAEEVDDDEIEEVFEKVEVDEILEEAEPEDDIDADDGEEVDADDAEIIEDVLAEDEAEAEEVEEDFEELDEAPEEVAVEAPEEEVAIPSGQITQALDIVNAILSGPEAITSAVSPDELSKLEELKNTIEGLSQKFGREAGGRALTDGSTEVSKAGLAETGKGRGFLSETAAEQEGAWAGKSDGNGYGLGKGEGETGAKSYGPGKGEGEPGGKDGIAAERTLLAEHGLEEVGVAEDLDDAEAQEEVELDEDAEEIDENEIDDILEEIDIADSPEEVEAEEDLDDAEIEDGFEEVEVDEVPEETEEVEEIETDDDFEEIEIVEEPQEAGLPAGDPEEDDETNKDKLLAEAFDGYLGAMERFYNQYILIPEGEYIIGSKAPKGDEQPEHKVQLEPFYLGKFPVTNALFEVFVEKTGYVTTAEKLGYGTVYYGRFCEEVDEKTGFARFVCNATVRSETVKGAYWYQPSGLGSTLHKKRNYPVVQVSLEDAMAFAAWTGKRLPMENEWEAAARSARGYVFPWGDEWKTNACNVEENSVADATPVDEYKDLKNDLGIVDTLGNVLEWTTDAYQPAQSAGNTPIWRIVKGGSWISGNDIRLFSRFKVSPDVTSNILGFRCVAY